MFGLGFWEIVIIVLLIILVIGPDKVGPIARAVGRAMREMRRGVDEFKDTFQVDERIREIDEIKSEIGSSLETDWDDEEFEDVEVVRTDEEARKRDAGDGDG